jgi:hypothetical protein
MTMGQRHPYTAEQKAAVCDAMTSLVEKSPSSPDGCENVAMWLKIVGTGVMRRAMAIEIVWDDDEQMFRCI